LTYSGYLCSIEDVGGNDRARPDATRHPDTRKTKLENVMKKITYAFALFALMAISYTLGATSHQPTFEFVDYTDGEVQTELIMNPDGSFLIETHYPEQDAIEY
jgi:hypothetical protein